MANKLYEEKDVAKIAGKINSYTGEKKAYKLSEMADGVDEAAEAAADKKEAITAALIDRSIEEIVIPEGVTKIGGYCLLQCFSLKKLTIPNTVTHIDGYALGINSLTSLDIPDSVIELGNSCIYNCSKLESITFGKSLSAIVANNFNDLPKCVIYDFSKCEQIPQMGGACFRSINSEAKIIVPAKLYKSWIAATNWASYADYIEPDGPIPSEGLDINELGELVGRGSCTDSVIVVPDEVKTIAMNSFVEDATLDTLILPEREIGVHISDYSVYGSTLRVIENYYTSDSLAILSCPLELVTFLPSAKKIALFALNLKIDATYDFTRHTEVPRLDAWEDYYNVSAGTKFLVPASLYDEWINATNWTLIQPYIFPVETE